jgi:RimJ/RimL family protein N-acetyltransferase
MKLETERLILRDFLKEDWGRVLEYQSAPLYLRYNDWTERTPEAVQEFVGWFLDHQKQKPRIKFQLAVTLKSNNLLIGNCGVRMEKENAFEADIGYELDPNTGIKAMPQKRHTPSWILASAALASTAFGQTASPIMLVRRMSWKN